MSDNETSPIPSDAERCPHCEDLQAEIDELRALVRTLRAKNDELVRAATNRDYERPPHYL